MLDEVIGMELQEIGDELDAAREWFDKALKEAYGFVNYGDHDGYDGEDNDHHAHYAPYSYQQHQTFLWKFKHYHKEQLVVIDADLMNLKDYLNNKLEERSGEAAVLSSSLQDSVTMKKDDIMNRLAQSVGMKVEPYIEELGIALDEIDEEYRAKIELAQSKTAMLRSQIIYAVHVLRYAGGVRTHESYEPKLTGIDELDRITINEVIEAHPDDKKNYGGYGGTGGLGSTGIDELDMLIADYGPYQFAQVADKEMHLGEFSDKSVDEHDLELKQQIEDAKNAFNDLIETLAFEFD